MIKMIVCENCNKKIQDNYYCLSFTLVDGYPSHNEYYCSRECLKCNEWEDEDIKQLKEGTFCNGTYNISMIKLNKQRDKE